MEESLLGFGLEDQSAAMACLCCIEILEFAQLDAQGAVGLSIIRLDLDRAAQALDGIVMAPLGDCKQTQIKMNFGIARIDGQCSLVALHCFGGAAQAIEYIGHRHERICKVRSDADRFLEVVQRKLEFAGSTI